MVSEVAACSDVPSDEAGGMAPFQNDEFLRAYQELMNAVVGPLPFRKDKDKYLDGRDNQQVENSEPDGVDGVEGAAQRHTVSGAKRRKMDKKKLKKEESRKFPSIVGAFGFDGPESHGSRVTHAHLWQTFDCYQESSSQYPSSLLPSRSSPLCKHEII
jgi:hypothetical protein